MIGGGDADFHTKLVVLVRLSLGNALDLGHVRRAEFLFVVALLIEQSFCQFHQLGKGCLHGFRLFGKPALNLPIHTPQHGFELRGSTPLPAQMTRMAVTVVLEQQSWAYSHVTLGSGKRCAFANRTRRSRPRL